MKRLAVIAAASILASAPVAVMADGTNLTASVRIGLTFVDNEDTDSDFSIRNFGTRIKWKGEKDLERNGLKAIGYVELGLNPDNNSRGSSGADRTRQLWAGIAGGFGTVKVGAQYAAFYDMVSSHTDIAWWGSCWTQFECSRQTRVLKYEANSGPLAYSASFTGVPDDVDNDFADEVELGVNFNAGAFLVGAATTLQADEGDDDGGTLFGLVAKTELGPIGLALTAQFADKEFVDNTEDANNVTVSATYSNAYLVFNQGDNGDTNPFFATIGYTLNIGPSTLMYYELQTIDSDTDVDSETIARATLKFDF